MLDFRKTLMVLYCVLSTALAWCQKPEGKLVLYGSTLQLNLSDSSESRQGFVPIEILQDDSAYLRVISTRSARYEEILPFGHVYKVIYGGELFQSKSVEIDVSDVSGSALKRGFRLEIDMVLFEKQSASLAHLLQEPVAKAEYNSKEKMILFDADYTEEMYQRLKEVLQEKK